jgi:hypothetical protein
MPWQPRSTRTFIETALSRPPSRSRVLTNAVTRCPVRDHPISESVGRAAVLELEGVIRSAHQTPNCVRW